jgi:NADH-quinone oxidoreductase subunit G
MTKPETPQASAETAHAVSLEICFGTSCFLRGAQDLYAELMAYVKNHGIEARTTFSVSFCSEACAKGPVLSVNGRRIEHCTIEKAVQEIKKII